MTTFEFIEELSEIATVDIDEEIPEELAAKEWVLADEAVVGTPDPRDHYWWATESYITSTQIQLAFADDDVELGVFESFSDTPMIAVYWMDEDPFNHGDSDE